MPNVVESIFFEPGTKVTSEAWTYVGNGNGGYKKVAAYNVSPGGAYDIQEDGGCFSRGCRGSGTKCAGGSLVAAFAVTLVVLHQQKQLPSLSASSFMREQPESGYDCRVDVEGGPSAWPAAHRAWCCQAQQVLCPSDCEAGGEDASRSWSPQKKDLCCKDQGIGCAAGSPSAPEARSLGGCSTSCEIGGEAVTCQDRIAWLARNRYHGETSGCPKAVAEVKNMCKVCEGCEPRGEQCEAFDCQADLYQWQHRWPSDKQHWCCQREGKGCAALAAEGEPRLPAGQREPGGQGAPTAPLGAQTQPAQPVVLPFHCGVGLASWGWGWSDAKKEWCCENQDIACKPKSAAAFLQ